MAYKALYRSYRPNSFSSVIGQEHIIKTLKNALTNNKTSHAYIFSGPRGIGKTTIARILAKAINCEDLHAGEPCNKCSSCRMINNNETPDIVEFDAASNNGVDEIRNVLEKVNFLPSVLKYKVYIIDEVHMLSISAFNALLKTLEEPPAHVMFIMATTEPHKIPATILSRCQRFDFKPLTVKEIKSNLTSIAEKEKIAIEEEALNLVAEASDGGMRDAIGILDQVNSYSTKEITLEDVNNVTGRISNQKLIELMQVINENNSAKAVELTNDLLSLGKEVSRLVQGLLQLCRDILLYQSTDGEANDKLIYNDMAFKMLCNNLNKKKIFYYIEVLSDVQNKIKFSLSQKIFLEVGIMKMASASRDDYNTQSNQGALLGEVLPNDIEERLVTLEVHLNKIKSELVKLNLNEFQNETKEKLTLLENTVIKNNSNIDYSSFEERLIKLEEKEIVPNINLDAINEEIEMIKKQLEGNNNIESNDSAFMKEELETIEASIQLAFNQIEELSTSLKTKEHKEPEALTLFDFNQSNDKEELELLKSQYEELKTQLEALQHTYSNIEASLNELVLTDSKVEASIQKRENPYEQKVLDIVEVQRKIEEEKELVEPIVENYVQEDMFKNLEVQEVAEQSPLEQFENQLSEDVTIETLEETSTTNQQDIENDTLEETKIPEEMTRPIDDFFTNPVFFNKPLEETPVEPVLEEVKEPVEPIVEERKVEPIVEKVDVLPSSDEQKSDILSLDDFEREVEEELHYELSCNINQLESGLRAVAINEKIPLDTLNYVVLNLYNMKDDIKLFITDKQEGKYIQEPSLGKDANKNIKTFLITVSGREAMVASTKDKEIKGLIAEIKELIKEFRNFKEQTLEIAQPVVVPVLEPKEEKIIEQVHVEPVVEPALNKMENEIIEEIKELPVENESPLENVDSQPEESKDIYEEVLNEPTIMPIVEEIALKKEEVETPNTTFKLDNLVIKEEEPVKKESVQSTYKRATVLETTAPRTLETISQNVPRDNPYAIEKIEMVMHDSRSEISREERKIIINNWQRLGDRVGTALSPVARFLMDGVPVVNGNNCIIITYPNAALCNHIMGDKIHFEAKQILKITFGREYDFVALPENIWQEKRNEYRGQYQMGTRFPKLTPINNPELKIIKKSFVDEKSPSYNKAVDLFGENLIKEEEE